MTVAVLGHGNVGGALARALSSKGVQIILAVDPSRAGDLPDWAQSPSFNVMPPADACGQADVLLLAVPFGALEEAAAPLRGVLAGKTVIDCTNPVGPGLTHGLDSVRSGSEFLQSLLPESSVVKCFSIYGFENFGQAQTSNPRPAMLFCGDDPAAKGTTSELVSLLGWEPVDVGGLDQALHLEHMTLLWIKMVRIGGASVHTLWSRVVSQ